MLQHQPEEQLLGEREVTAVLRRAVELQAREGGSATRADSEGRISVTQLEQAAAELGIPPSLIREAAHELADGNGSSKRGSLWGGPGLTDLHESVRGTVDEASWPLLLDKIREATGRVGTASQNGRAYEWTSTSPDVMHIAVTPVGEEVRLRVMTRYGEWAGLTYVGYFLLAMVLSAAIPGGLHLDAPTGFALAAGWFSGGFLAGRATFNRICNSRRRQTREVMRRLRAHLGASKQPK